MSDRRLKELQTIPGIGPSIAADLYALGYRKVSDLKGENPEHMYKRSNRRAGVRLDPCLLYTYRCAVYYASHTRHDPKKLLWWNWKDKS